MAKKGKTTITAQKKLTSEKKAEKIAKQLLYPEESIVEINSCLKVEQISSVLLKYRRLA